MKKLRHPGKASFVLILLFALFSCSTPSPQLSEPQESPTGPPGTETFTILGTNDIHGAIVPMNLKTREPKGVPAVKYQAGGLAYLASYVKRLRDELGDRLIWLDAGDEYQGSIESNSNRGAMMVKFFNATGLNAAAVGNHEFDFGAEAPDTNDLLSNLKHRMREAHYPYLAANIYNKKTGKLEDFPNTFPSKIFEVGKLKVGVIGLTTVETPTTTRPENVATLKFGSFKNATLREAKALRAEGAQAIVVVAHSGLFCDLAHTPPGHLMRKPTDVQGSCERNSEIVRYLDSLPQGTVDAVVSGHTHSVVYHYVDGVPVIQGGAYGRYFNLIHLTYDFKKHRIIPADTRIEGPIPVCPMVFKNQGDCNGDRPAPSIGRGPLVRPIFRRTEIKRDDRIQAVLQPAIDQAARIKAEVYGQAARPIENYRNKESPLGDLIADSLRKATNADFALVNAGGIRAPFEEGPITYGEIFRTLPFDNNVVVLTVTGKRLKQILRIAESGSRGFHSLSGLQVRLISPRYDAPAKDLNHDGRIEPWEINRLIEARTSSGVKIKDNQTYKLATIDFLVSGGDDYGWVMKKIPLKDQFNTGEFMRDVMARYVRQLTQAQGSINSADHPVLLTSAPRLIFVQPKSHHSRRRYRYRHHHRSHHYRHRRKTHSAT